MVTKEYPFYKLGELLPSSYKNGIYKSADSYGKGTSILRINDFDNYGNLISENLLKVDLTPEEKESYKLGYNDIVVNRVNSLTHIGKSILWKHSNEIAVVYESNMMRIQPNESILYPDYLIKILQSENARNFFKKVAKQAVAQCSINQQDVKSLPIPLPPLPEQKKIAEILSTWDKAIETVEKLVTNSQQQKKALMQQLLTGQKRLLDDNGMKLEDKWENIKLKNLIKECQKEKETDPNRIELLTVKLHNKGVVASGKFPNATEKGRPYYKRLEGELIIGRQNLHNGGVGIVPSECNGLIASNAISSFQPLENVDIKFILYMMMTNHFKYLVDNLSGGTGQKEVSVNELMKVNLLVPSFEEQRKIAQVLTLADREIDLYQQQLDKLKLEKKALMQQLLTGQKRVKLDS